MKCNEYYPNRHILNWSNCGHTICIQCAKTMVTDNAVPSARTMILDRRQPVPHCVVQGCDEKLALNALNSIIEPPLFLRLCTECDHYVICFGMPCFQCDKRVCSVCVLSKMMQWPGCRHQWCLECASDQIVNNILNDCVPACLCGMQLDSTASLPPTLHVKLEN